MVVIPTFPLIFTVVAFVICLELAVNTTDVCPAGTTTLAGTVRATFPDVNITLVPPAGAGPVIRIVTSITSPPTTVVRLATTELITGGFTLTLVDFFNVPS